STSSLRNPKPSCTPTSPTSTAASSGGHPLVARLSRAVSLSPPYTALESRATKDLTQTGRLCHCPLPWFPTTQCSTASSPAAGSARSVGGGPPPTHASKPAAPSTPSSTSPPATTSSTATTASPSSKAWSP